MLEIKYDEDDIDNDPKVIKVLNDVKKKTISKAVAIERITCLGYDKYDAEFEVDFVLYYV